MKYTICIINDTQEMILKGIYDNQIDALDNIKKVAKNYIKSKTMDKDIKLCVCDKINVDNTGHDYTYFLKNENSACVIYKKEVKPDSGIFSYIYGSNVIELVKIATVNIITLDTLGMKLTTKDKLGNLKDIIDDKDSLIKKLEQNVVIHEKQNKKLKEKVRILMSDKSKLQQANDEQNETIKKLNNECDALKNKESGIKNIEVTRTEPKQMTIANHNNKVDTNNNTTLKYIDEMISFLGTQLADPQLLIKPSKLRTHVYKA